MPSLYHLNTPPNPFWTFVHDLEDHPFFAGGTGPPGENTTENVAPATGQASGSGEQARGQQPTVEDPPEVDPATINANATENQPQSNPWAGRGRFFNPQEGQHGPSRRGHGCRGRGGHMGPPPFMFGGGPFWARQFAGMDNPEHQQPHEHPHHGPGPHRRGPPGPHRSRGGRHAQPEGFNLGEFLNNLGNRLGVDLSGAAENMGLDRFTAPRGSTDSDFEPRGDIFDTASSYIVHLSLPGAQKSDVGVDWDGENSVLRIAGVVHRPGADEELLSKLVVDQRKREVGVFEKNIRLGTRRDPASIDIAGITAKMLDGVLVVTVPKVEAEHRKRDVPISASPVRDGNEKSTEKVHEPLLQSTPPALTQATAPQKELSEKDQIAAHAYQTEQQQQRDVRSETMDVDSNDHEHAHAHEENAPAYAAESDWEKDGGSEEDEEGEYVKINVD